MALPLKSGADLYNNQALRLRLHNLGADPTEVGAGLIYFNTSTGLNTSQKARLYTGSAWKTIAFSEDLDVASNADFLALKDKVDTLIGDGVDMDGIIESWKEVEAFLSGMSDTKSLMDLLNGKLNTSGGTIDGDIKINSIDGTPALIYFSVANSGRGALGCVAAGPVYYDVSNNGHEILHSGNIGEYAVARNRNIPFDTAITQMGYGTQTGGWEANGAAFVMGYDESYRFFLQASYTGNGHIIKTRYYGDGLWRGDWKTIAFTDSNVASATKLETARTIWGQLFDGTSDISGNLTIGKQRKDYTTQNYLYLWKGDGTYRHRGMLYVSEKGASYDYYNPDAGIYRQLLISPNGLVYNYTDGGAAFLINSSGNVTIGASDLSAANGNPKLYVDGAVTMASTLSVEGQTTLSSLTFSSANTISIDGNGNIKLSAKSGTYWNVATPNGINALTCYYNGNVGIGTTEPYCLLEVAAIHKDINPINIAASANFAVGKHKDDGLFIGHDYTKKGSWIQSAYYGTESNPSNTHTYKLFLNPLGGNVLIGTTDDNGAKLQVNGGIYADTFINFSTNASYGVFRGNLISARLSSEDIAVASPKFYIGATCLIGDTKVVDSEARMLVYGKTHIEGDLHVTGNIIADGEVSAGGRAEEGSTSGSGAGAFHSESIGVGATQTTIAHGLGTDDIVVSIYEKDGVSGRWSLILTDVEVVDANNIIVSFGSATNVVHKVVIMGAVA